jgi:hypothetical protein
VDIFAIESSAMDILDAKYEKADLDASYLNLFSHLLTKQKVGRFFQLSRG